MKKLCLLSLLFAMLLPASLPAADQPPPPELVLPEVTLDIRDLSVEKIEAMLPPAGAPVVVKEDVLLPPAPLLAIEPPVRTLAVEGSDPLGGAAAAQRPLATQATLGIGTQNRVVGDLDVETTGTNSQATLSFSHDSADGISGQPQGSGFDARDDVIAGSLSGRLGMFDGGFKGSYSENEVGLQQLASPYVYRLGRNLNGTLTLRVQALDWLTVNGSVTGLTDSLTLASNSPSQAAEYKGSSHLGADARSGILTAGISGDYDYRLAHMIVPGDDQVQRLRTGASLRLDFSSSFLLEGSVAWFWNTQFGSLLPFSIHATVSPFSALTLDGSFGYRVVPYDESDILALNPYLVPVGLVDDRGWFAEGGAQLALSDIVSLRAKLSFMNSAAMLTSGAFTATTPDSFGLYSVSQISAVRLTGDAGLRWTILPGVTLDTGWKREFIDRPSFAPVDLITAEALAMETTGAYGGRVSASLLTGLPPSVQLPELDVGGFVRLSEPAQLHLDLYDLLWPLTSGQRRYGPSLYPYVEPGFRVVASVRLSF